MQNLQKFASFVLAATAAFALVGCGSSGMERCAVRGVVSVEGVPVENGAITFTPEPGTTSPVVGATIVDGKYEIAKKDGPAPGTYQVKFVGNRKTGEMREVPGTGKTAEGVENVIAEKYAVPGGSEIQTATIKSGKNEVNFDLDAE